MATRKQIDPGYIGGTWKHSEKRWTASQPVDPPNTEGSEGAKNNFPIRKEERLTGDRAFILNEKKTWRLFTNRMLFMQGKSVDPHLASSEVAASFFPDGSLTQNYLPSAQL